MQHHFFIPASFSLSETDHIGSRRSRCYPGVDMGLVVNTCNPAPGEAEAERVCLRKPRKTTQKTKGKENIEGKQVAMDSSRSHNAQLRDQELACSTEECRTLSGL